MAKYRKKPVEIEAIQWTGENIKEVLDFMKWKNADHDEKNGLIIHTLEGSLTASVGDFIVKGGKGEHWPVRKDIFPTLYDKI